MSTVALVFELVSHVAYVPAIAVALYGARGQLALAFSYTILFSLHYHVCLDSPVCITTLARAGALARIPKLVVTRQLSADPPRL